ncbi:MAG: hydrogenase maturation protease [PVC group bacterium]|nr:hydrogenase maturation protease [PVC group bacterium]
MTLIIGCGNILLADEGVGVHFIETLKKKKLPNDIELLDGGTGGIELIPYIEKVEKIIIVDAVQSNGEKGAIYKLRPEDYEQDSPALGSMSLHEISLKDLFVTMRQLNMKKDITIFAVEPADVKLNIGLSPTLKKIMPKLISLVLNDSGVQTENVRNT